MVTPYFTQHSPPALVATLPPIEQISYDDGSGGYHRPCSAAAAFTSALNAPGSTTATRQSVSISIARIRSRLSTIPPSTALDPPDRPLPAPRAERPGPGARAAQRTAACTWSASSARTTASGLPAVDVLGPVEAVLLHRVGVGDHHAVRQGSGQLGERVHAPMQPLTPAAMACFVRVGDVPELPPDQREGEPGPDEREPPRRHDPAPVRDQATEERADEHAAHHADHVDRADPALELRRHRALADGVGQRPPHERVGAEEEHQRVRRPRRRRQRHRRGGRPPRSRARAASAAASGTRRSSHP